MSAQFNKQRNTNLLLVIAIALTAALLVILIALLLQGDEPPPPTKADAMPVKDNIRSIFDPAADRAANQ